MSIMKINEAFLIPMILKVIIIYVMTALLETTYPSLVVTILLSVVSEFGDNAI
ncbi:9227_t:CDS:1, partial [Entrophospora sp. SA101]